MWLLEYYLVHSLPLHKLAQCSVFGLSVSIANMLLANGDRVSVVAPRHGAGALLCVRGWLQHHPRYALHESCAAGLVPAVSARLHPLASAGRVDPSRLGVSAWQP